MIEKAQALCQARGSEDQGAGRHQAPSAGVWPGGLGLHRARSMTEINTRAQGFCKSHIEILVPLRIRGDPTTRLNEGVYDQPRTSC
jgi:hypothetical protein